MRGSGDPQEVMLAFVDMEERVPKDHPLRTIKAVADGALKRLSPEFDRMYSNVGRASVPPERLLKASLLISLYSVRSERAFCEELEYNLLFRWFLDMNTDGTQLRPHGVHQEQETTAGTQARPGPVRRGGMGSGPSCLLSDEHFSVDGTLIEAVASIKSFRRRDEGEEPPGDDRGNPWVDFRGERLKNETHESRTDPEARLMRKGKGREDQAILYGPPR